MADIGYVWQEVPPAWEEFLRTPMEYADIRLYFGDQRQGKSITAVASVIDDYYQHLTHVVSPDGEFVKAHALNETEQAYLEAPIEDGGMGIKYNHLRHMRIFNDEGTKSKIVKVPSNYVVLSPVKVFANFHFYGIRFVYTDLENLISYINTPLMTAGWVVLDESVLTDRRDTSTLVGKFMVWFGAQCGKRHLRMIIASQYANMIQSRFHLFATTRAECSYDPDTSIVTLSVNKTSPIMSSTDYVSAPYRRFFNTNEIVPIPQHKINRAMETVVG